MINLEQENELLKHLVVDLCQMIKGLMEALPQDLLELEQSQKMLEVANKLIDRYIEHGTPLSTPRDRQ